MSGDRVGYWDGYQAESEEYEQRFSSGCVCPFSGPVLEGYHDDSLDD